MATPTAPDERGEPPGPKQRRPWSIAVYLLALALVTLVPGFLFAGTLMLRNQQAQEATVETLIVATTRSLVQAVEREINANITTLRVLATTPSLHEGDYRAFHAQTSRALETTRADLFVINPDMTTLLSTLQPFGLPVEPIADPGSAQRALETDEVVITNLVFGLITQDWMYNILLPVDLGRAGYKVLALTQQADNISQALLTNKLPEGWNTALLDEDGQVIAVSFGGGSTGDAFSAFDVMSQPFSTGWQRVETDGEAFMTVIQRSGLTGWRLVSWAPAAVITQPLTDAFLTLIAGGIVLALLIVLALFWVSKQIGSSVRGLARDARRLGRGEGVEAKPYPIAEIADVSAALADASAQRLSAEADVRFLMRELAHRSKNQMTVIAAMAKQTARGEDDVQHYVQSFEKRILGLASSTDLLLTHGRAGVELKELLEHQITPFAPADGNRVVIKGALVRLNAQAAQIMGMAAHELATNAVKYGAFSNDHGTLAVTWVLDGETLNLTWTEDSGRPVKQASENERTGFGTTVINSMVGSALNATVERRCTGRGIKWCFAIPLASLHPDYAAATEDGEAD
jgi:two-component sensor histidine kinase